MAGLYRPDRLARTCLVLPSKRQTLVRSKGVEELRLIDRHYRVGVDIGGTFTDLVLIEEATGERTVGKVLTTPKEPSEAVERGLLELLEQEEIATSRLEAIIHGTTLVTNALIERKGARTALLTTEGFRDAVAIGTEHRYDMYDIFIEKPEPLAPRSLRYGVRERMLDDGSVAIRLDDDQVRQMAAELREREVEAVAVSFLHSFATPPTSGGPPEFSRRRCRGFGEIREYERTSTTMPTSTSRPASSATCATLRSGCAARVRRRAARHALERRPGQRRDSPPVPGPAPGIWPGGRGAGRRVLTAGERGCRTPLLRHGWHHRQGAPDRGRRAAHDQRVRGRPRSIGSRRARGCRSTRP